MSYWMSILAAEPYQIVVDPGSLALLIPIIAVVLGFATAIVKSIMHHRERMAKIGMGIDPDAPKAQAGEQGPLSHFGR